MHESSHKFEEQAPIVYDEDLHISEIVIRAVDVVEGIIFRRCDSSRQFYGNVGGIESATDSSKYYLEDGEFLIRYSVAVKTMGTVANFLLPNLGQHGSSYWTWSPWARVGRRHHNFHRAHTFSPWTYVRCTRPGGALWRSFLSGGYSTYMLLIALTSTLASTRCCRLIPSSTIHQPPSAHPAPWSRWSSSKDILSQPASFLSPLPQLLPVRSCPYLHHCSATGQWKTAAAAGTAGMARPSVGFRRCGSQRGRRWWHSCSRSPWSAGCSTARFARRHIFTCPHIYKTNVSVSSKIRQGTNTLPYGQAFEKCTARVERDGAEANALPVWHGVLDGYRDDSYRDLSMQIVNR